jgi:FMN phosphatase YigB (HAD superfamily)
MEKHKRISPSRGWNIGGNVGLLALIHSLIPDSLPRLHSYIPSDFNNMERVLKWLEKHEEYDLISFDVFDTLLTRRIDPPELIKSLSAEYVSAGLDRAGVNVSTSEILKQRSKTEEALLREADSNGRDADYRLDDVWRDTLKELEASSILASTEVVNYEIELEKKAAQAMPGVIAVLSHLKSSGKRVICISDSYLSSSQMAAILESQGLMAYIDKLYVSCEIGIRKSTGRLFHHVLEQEGSNLVHIGDNYGSDNIIPRRLGVTALWFSNRAEISRKKELKRLRLGKNKMDYVNAIIWSPEHHQTELQRVGYNVLGPALTVFIHNVAEQAKGDKVEALFFIARDGYAMKKIYETLQRTIYVESTLPPGRYMCLGRLPVRLASLHELSYADIMKVYGYIARFPGRTVSLADIIGSYGLEPDHFVSIAKQYSLDLHEAIINPDQDEGLHRLLSSDDFQRLVKEKSDAARVLLRDYLTGIGFMSKKKVAVVDANAEGLTQTILDMIFSDDKDYPAVSRYYFNLLTLDVDTGDVKPDLSKALGIVTDWRRDTLDEQALIKIFGLLIELFCHPNHGVAVGYKKIGGRTVPAFRKTPQERQYNLTSQGLQGILNYTRDYGTYYALHNYNITQLLDDMKRNVRLWILKPPKVDAVPLKDLSFTSDWPVETNHRLLQTVIIWDIVTIQGVRRKVGASAWPQATLALAPVSWFIRMMYLANNFVSKLWES